MHIKTYLSTNTEVMVTTRKRLAHLIIVSTGFLYLFISSGCANITVYANQKPSPDTISETFTFPTRNVSGFKELISGNGSSNHKGHGQLLLPKGASAVNKVPLMIILHGSGGTWAGREARHANILNQNGIGALIIDTFANRGLSRKDKYIPRLMEVNFPDQLTDAFAALNGLQRHPFVDGDKIGLMGYSMGGISTILAAYENIAAACSNMSDRFALHIAFYAPCIIQPEKREPTDAPVVALWGLEDESTPRSSCDGFLSTFEKEGCLATTTWYEGAAHGWNGTKQVKFYKGVPNFAPCEFVIHDNGQVTERKTGKVSDTDRQLIETSEYCVDFGYSIGRHDKTNELANAELLKAINQHMWVSGRRVKADR